ncbi:MAG TPA: host attachment protein [Dyella sp.]|uniref:host attachment protein n=1 Tax=Dyella sp. TaxID=1869338 RepID=UPI002B92F913|nr:host attachment protein [Dyella sp.]HUB88104.1 host attachment protein [Dyella sp.]
MSRKTWVLVADAAKARLFELAGKGTNLTEIACYTHPNGRAPGCHPMHGRLPRTHESMGASRHAIEPKTTLKDKHAKEFADTLSNVVQHGRLQDLYDDLVLIAPPRFLGTLHECMDEQTLKRVVSELGNDLMTLSPAELRSHLPA